MVMARIKSRSESENVTPMLAARIQTSDNNSIMNPIKVYYWLTIFMIWDMLWR